MEKKAILNSFKIFLKTCEFDIQVLIQSTKEDLSKHILFLEEEQKKKENYEINWLYKEYYNYILEDNYKNNFSNKNFIIIIKENYKKEYESDINIQLTNLNDKYYKIRESLVKCGNSVDIYKRNEVIEILHNLFNN